MNTAAGSDLQVTIKFDKDCAGKRLHLAAKANHGSMMTKGSKPVKMQRKAGRVGSEGGNRPVNDILIDFEGQASDANMPHKALLLELLKSR